MLLRAIAVRDADKNSTDNWWAFGLHGLAVNDVPDWVHTPLFGDATILSPNHLAAWIDGDPTASARDRQVAKWLLGLDRSDCPAEDLRRFERIYGVPHSFLVVRRKGEPGSPEAHTNAHRRAEELVALLALFALTNGAEGKTIGFTGQHRPPALGPRAIFEASANPRLLGHAQHPASYYPISLEPSGAFQLDRRTLLSPTKRAYYKELWSLVVERDKQVSKGLRKRLVEATVRLFGAIHARSFDSRLLGAITTLEILISDRNWDRLKVRVRALVGDGSEDTYHLDKLFRLRHKVVHERAHVDAASAMKALGLASSAILSTAFLTYKLPSPDALQSYLDFVAAAQRALPMLPEAHQRSLRASFLHVPAIHYWPWLDRIEEVAKSNALLPDSSTKGTAGGPRDGSVPHSKQGPTPTGLRLLFEPLADD